MGASALVGLGAARRIGQRAAAEASGLAPARDLSHLPAALQQTALWTLADGGFERRVLHGMVSRERADVAVTAFDLETLRERRGEWAYLPVEPPFRIGGVVTVVACELARDLPHVLLKRAGLGDKLIDDDPLERAGSIMKLGRDALGVSRSYPAELPATLPAQPVAAGLPDQWRAYTRAPDALAQLIVGGLHDALARTARRDLVIELLGPLALIYPGAHAAPGADGLADLVTTALQLADAICDATAVAPRGLDART
jgi:hypothetical protein